MNKKNLLTIIITSIVLVASVAAALFLLPENTGPDPNDKTENLRIYLQTEEKKEVVFDYNARYLKEVPVQFGEEYKIIIDNTLPKTFYVTLLGIDETRFELIQGRTVHYRSEKSIDSISVLVESEIKEYFVLDFTNLQVALKDEDNKNIYLAKDIICAEDVFTQSPFKIDLNKFKLQLNNFIIDSDKEGKAEFVLYNKTNFITNNIFIDAELWDVNFDFLPDKYSKDAQYYFDLKTLNNESFNNGEITVDSKEKFISLFGDDYPKLKDNLLIKVNGSFSIDLEKTYIIDKAVSFILNGSIDISSGGISIEYKGSNTLTVDETNNAKTIGGKINFDTPNADLKWMGKNAPKKEYVFTYMNVKTYNGQKPQDDLGGSGVGKITSLSTPSGIFTIEGNQIHLAVYYSSNIKKVKITAVLTSGTLEFERKNSDGSVDLSSPLHCYVKDDKGNKRGYLITAGYKMLNLPVINIYTKGNAAVESKEVYVSCSVNISNDKFTLDATAGIKGHGHTSWKWDKKAYRLKFDKKTSVLGMPEAKNWILIASYADKSLMRNLLASEIGKKLTNMSFVAQMKPVDVFLNGKYIGVYLISEKIEEKTNRINLSNSKDVDTGYILEIGGSESANGDVNGKDFFHAKTLKFVMIKHPDTKTELTPAQFTFIRDYVTAADNAVVNLSGYEDYIDVDSLIDWFILHEFAHNLDSSFRRSCYLTKDAGGKLKMGPPWDFDLAFDNFKTDKRPVDSWASVGTSEEKAFVKITWMNYLLEDPNFTSKLKARWNEIKTVIYDTAIKTLDYNYALIAPSAEENFKVWDVLGKQVVIESPKQKDVKTYKENIDFIKDYLKKRYAWMDKTINEF